MYTIDRQKFGAFVGALRREKGMTQRELAAALFLSDKAVSKWETGASIPDTALLIPLAELLGVSVSELLLCERVARDEPMPPAQVDALVKTALSCSELSRSRTFRQKSRWPLLFLASLLLGAAEYALLHRMGLLPSGPLLVFPALAAVFGAYFCCFAVERLPSYFDENRINAFSDGIIRIHVPGLRLTNGNWPYLLRVMRLWSAAMLTLFPPLLLLRLPLPPALWARIGVPLCAAVSVGGLLLPFYLVGKKHE